MGTSSHGYALAASKNQLSSGGSCRLSAVRVDCHRVASHYPHASKLPRQGDSCFPSTNRAPEDDLAYPCTLDSLWPSVPATNSPRWYANQAVPSPGWAPETLTDWHFKYAVFLQPNPDFRGGHHRGEGRKCPSHRLRRRHRRRRPGQEHSGSQGNGQDHAVCVRTEQSRRLPSFPV